MLKQIEFLSSVEGTLYLIEKSEKTVLPIPQAITKPQTPDTIRRILAAFGINIMNAKIYLQRDDVFYTYLTLSNCEKICEINLSFLDAINFTQDTNAPILIESEILDECGIKVTKQMLEEALI
jgi:bifunctional DNase/RNase